VANTHSSQADATIVHMFKSLSLSMTMMVVEAMAYLIMIIGQPTLLTNFAFLEVSKVLATAPSI